MKASFLLKLFILLSAVIAIYFAYSNQYLLYSIFKPLTSILIIVLAFTHRTKSQYATRILIALFFCLLGDVFLLKNTYFVYGLGSFLIGHLLFVYAFTSLGGFKRTIAPLLGLLAYGICFFLFIKDGLGELLIPVIVYIIAIILMSWQGLSLYIQKKTRSFALIGIASLLFVLSDSIIAIDKFKFSHPVLNILMLATYWLSISLFANSTRHISITDSGT